MMKGISSITDVVKLLQDPNEATRYTFGWTELLLDWTVKSLIEHVSFGKNKELLAQSNYFSDKNIQIKTEESVKDLGIILCSDMT